MQSRALDEQLKPMLLESAPAALGTGYRCMEKGYGFYWPPYSRPFMVTPHGGVLPHEVEDYLPYLPEPDNFSLAISQKPPVGLPGVPARACPGAATSVGQPDASAEKSLDVCQEVVDELRADPNSLEHLMTHLPKNRAATHAIAQR